MMFAAHFDSINLLNQILLFTLATHSISISYIMIAKKISLDSVKTDFQDFRDRKHAQKSFREFVYEYLSTTKRDDKYKKMYLQAYNYLAEYSEDIGYEMFTHNLTEEFAEGFLDFLRTKGLMLSTVKAVFGKVIALLNKADRRGYAVDKTFSDCSIKDEECDSVYLNMIEITRIYYYKGLKAKEEIVRDYFVLGCLTGLRFSDYSRITRQNFQGDLIIIRTKKTGALVKIPIHPFVKEIFTKYEWKLPPCHCIQAFNRQVKNICKKIGINTPITYNRTHGYEVVTKTIPKYDMISSHTARRSCATNMYKEGIATWVIMQITGHRTERAFFRYIRITQDEAINSLKGHKFFAI